MWRLATSQQTDGEPGPSRNEAAAAAAMMVEEEWQRLCAWHDCQPVVVEIFPMQTPLTVLV